MFNYYTYQKKRNESLKEKNKKIKEIKMIKINKVKRDELAHNYEQRVKKFIYKLSEDPNYLSKTNTLFFSLKNNNTSKISDNNESFINKRRFCFSNFETDRMKAEKYDQEHKKLEKLINEQFPLKKENNQIHKNQSFSPKIKFNYKLLNNNMDPQNNVENDNNIMIQPRLRFRPRNDMERLLDEIKDLRLFQGNIDYLNALKKQIIKMQKLEFNNEMKKTNDLNQLYVNKKEIKNYKKINNIKNKKINEDYKSDNTNMFNDKLFQSYNNTNNDKNLFNDEKINKKNNIINILDARTFNNNELSNDYLSNYNSEDNENLESDNDLLIKNKKNKKNCLMNEDIYIKNKDFLYAKKNLHKGYDIKTYFNCMKNYSLWKESCFINSNLFKKKNNPKRIDNYKNKFHFSSMIDSPKSTSSSYFSSLNKIEKNKNYSKTFYKNMNNLFLKNRKKKRKNLTPKQLVLLLNNHKKNDIFEIDKNISSICSSDRNNNNIDYNKLNDNKKKLAIIKKIAFDKDFKGYNYIHNKTTENYEKYKKSIFNLKVSDDEEIVKNDSFNKDIGEICNNILKNFGFIKKISQKGN